MSKTVTFFLVLLIVPIFINSYGLSEDEVILFEDSSNFEIFNSNIIDIDSNFFNENNFKRYLIFGSNSLPENKLNNNSLYGIQSDHGFFYVSILSDKDASNLISKGYTVIEDTKLDFHSSNEIIEDVSRIGSITDRKSVV